MDTRRGLSFDYTLATPEVPDRSLRLVFNDFLKEECWQWGLYLEGLTRDEAIIYLLNQIDMQKSDGVDCDFRRGESVYDDAGYYARPQLVDSESGQRTPAPCICARLLGVLHDVPFDEMDRAMFARLMGFLDLGEEK